MAVESGRVPPLAIGSVNLDVVSTVAGNSLGMTSPEPEWVRLRWGNWRWTSDPALHRLESLRATIRRGAE